MTDDRRGKVVTFYSFKGGTGRTMALANVAWILAANGKRVLVVDWDLESPGLDRFFHPFIDPSMLASAGGVIKMIRDYEWQTTVRSPNQDWYKSLAQVQDKAFSLKWQHFPDGGTLDILTTGRQNLEYHQNVATLNWDDFYERLNGGVFFDAMRADMKEHYDYTLIDSRTGFSDVAEICTIQLPDILVDCFTFTDQGIEGSARVANSVQSKYGVRNIRILPVPMRVEPFELAKVQAGQQLAMQRFAGLPAGLSDEQRREYWSRVQVPYVPFFAYEETLAVFAPESTPGSMLAAYERLTTYLTEGEVTKLPPMAETVRARTARRFERQLKPSIGAVRIHHAPEDQLWFEWIEQLLLSAGVQVIDDDPATSDPAGDEPVPLFVLSGATGSSFTAALAASDADRAMGVYLSPVPLVPLLPENTVSLTGLHESEAIEELLRLVGRPGMHAPLALPARYPAEPTTLFLGPARDFQFTGREDDLIGLRAELSGRGARRPQSFPVVLYGMSGVGKTQIALEYAHRYGNAYDLVYWIGAADASESATFIDQKLNELARNMGIASETTITDNIRVVLAALTRGDPYARWLLIFDNSNAPERDKQFLPHGNGHVIITTNVAGWERYARRIPVEVFTREESREHLQQQVASMSDADADRIAESLEDLPIAVHNAGAFIADTGQTVDEYLREIKLGDSVTRSFTLAFERLRERSPAAFRLLQLCSVLAPYIALDFIYSEPFARALLAYDPTVASRDARENLVQHMSQLALVKIDPKEIPIGSITGAGPGAGLMAESRINPTGGFIHMHGVVARVARDSMPPAELEKTRREVHQLLVASRPMLEVDDPDSWRGYKALWPHQEASGAIESIEPSVRQLLLDRVRYIYLHGGFAQGDALAAHVSKDWEKALAGMTDPAEHRAMQSDLLRLRFNHANILRSRGYFQRAYDLDQKVIAEQMKLFGARNPHTLRTLGSLGGDLRALGRYEEALEQDERLYASWVELGPEHRVNTLQAMSNLAVSNRLAGHYQAALELDQEAYQGRRRVLSDKHTKTLDSRGAIGRDLRKVGLFRQAVEEMERLVVQLEEFYGADSRGCLVARSSLAASLRLNGQAAEAEQIFEVVYPQLRDGLGPQNDDTLTCRMNRALALIELKRLERAREELDAVRDSYREILGPRHPHTLICDNNLAAILKAAGDVAAAEQLAAIAVTNLSAALHEDHPHALLAELNRAATLAELGNRDQAIEIARSAARRLNRMLGPHHPDVHRAEADIALLEGHNDLGKYVRRLVSAYGVDHPVVVSFRERRLLFRTIEPDQF